MELEQKDRRQPVCPAPPQWEIQNFISKHFSQSSNSSHNIDIESKADKADKVIWTGRHKPATRLQAQTGKLGIFFVCHILKNIFKPMVIKIILVLAAQACNKEIILIHFFHLAASLKGSLL